MLNWLRKLFTFHVVSEVCPTCEVLKMELAFARDEKALLLEKLLDSYKPPVDIKISQPDEAESNLRPITIGKKHIPHQVRQQIIRQNDEALLTTMRNSQREMAEARSRSKEVISDESPVTKEAVAELERDVLGVT